MNIMNDSMQVCADGLPVFSVVGLSWNNARSRVVYKGKSPRCEEGEYTGGANIRGGGDGRRIYGGGGG